jgi:holo-[acyl-carrier protein] synthase
MRRAGPSGRAAIHDPKRPPLAVGIDAVAVADVESALSHFGDRYLARLFTPHEIASSSDKSGLRARDLANCFAAKEATLKALGPSGQIPPWQSIELHREPGGRCDLRLNGPAADLASRAHLSEFVVSLGHEGDLAVAVVFAVARAWALGPASSRDWPCEGRLSTLAGRPSPILDRP